MSHSDPSMPQTDISRPKGTLLSDSLWRLAQIVSSSGFAALFVTLYTAVLPKDDFAAFGTAVTINQLLQFAANFGIRQTIARFIAKARGENRPDRVRAYTLSGLKLSSAFSLITLLIGLGLSGVLEGFFSGRADSGIIVILTLCVGAAAGLSLLFQGVLEGLGAFRKVMFCNAALNILQTLCLAFLFLFDFTVTVILAVELLIMLVSIVLYGIPALREVLPHPRSNESSREMLKESARYCLPVFLNSVGGFLYTKADVLFVKHYLSESDTADYFLMMYIFSFPLHALGAYIFVLNTEVSVCLGRKDIARIWHLFLKSEVMGVKFGLLLTPLFVLASYIVVWIFPEYAGTGHLMRLIAPMVFLKCISHMASGAFMLSMGWVRVMATITISGGLLNLALNFLFIPLWGVDGAVYSTLLGHTATALTTLTFVFISLRRRKNASAGPEK